MPGIEELAEFQKKQKLVAAQRRFEQARHVVNVGRAMEELITDPRWAVYGNHVEALRVDYEERAKGHERILTGREFLDPQRYGQVRVEMAEAAGIAKGLKMALDVVEVLINRGEAAAGEKIDEIKGSGLL